MTRRFIELTSLHTDEPVKVNPIYVAVVSGSYVHTMSNGWAVKESHEEIMRQIAEWEQGSALQGSASQEDE